jgi:hypothetical protein
VQNHPVLRRRRPHHSAGRDTECQRHWRAPAVILQRQIPEVAHLAFRVQRGAQKDLRGEARENRRAEAYRPDVVASRWSATKPMSFSAPCYVPRAMAVMHGNPSIIVWVLPEASTSTTSPSAVATSAPLPSGAAQISITPPRMSSVSNSQLAPS